METIDSSTRKKIKTTSLSEILKRRDERFIYQQKLVDDFQKPLITFQINIPGSIKYSALCCLIHAAGSQEIFQSLTMNQFKCLFMEIRHEITGIEGYYVVDTDPFILKKLCCEIEENHALGRLFDMDVMDRSGYRISRLSLGCLERTCMICGKDVLSCRREMKHSGEEYFSHIQSLVLSYFGFDAEMSKFFQEISMDNYE